MVGGTDPSAPTPIHHSTHNSKIPYTQVIINPQTHPYIPHTHTPTINETKQYARGVLECDDFFLKFLEPFKRLKASDEAKAWVSEGKLAFEVRVLCVCGIWLAWESAISDRVHIVKRPTRISPNTPIPTHPHDITHRPRPAPARACTFLPPERTNSRPRRSVWRRGRPKACWSFCWIACPPPPRRAVATRRARAAPDRTRSCKGILCFVV